MVLDLVSHILPTHGSFTLQNTTPVCTLYIYIYIYVDWHWYSNYHVHTKHYIIIPSLISNLVHIWNHHFNSSPHQNYYLFLIPILDPHPQTHPLNTRNSSHYLNPLPLPSDPWQLTATLSPYTHTDARVHTTPQHTIYYLSSH